MPKTKLNIIKPALGVTDITDGDLLARLNAVHDGMLNNPAYPTRLSICPASRPPLTSIRLLPQQLSKGGVCHRGAQQAPGRCGHHAASTRALCGGRLQGRHEGVCLEWFRGHTGPPADSDAANLHTLDREDRSG